MRVLHVMGRFEPSGTERQLAGMLHAAQGEHWDATLCVLRPGSPFAAELTSSGVRVVELAGRADRDPRRVLDLRRLAGEGFDVVHSSLWGANMVTRVALGVGRRPAVVTSERRVEDYRGRPAREVDRVLRSRSDAWIGNSDDVADFIVRAHGVPRSRVTVVRNGIDGTVFNPGDAPRPPRAGRTLKVGSLGRLVTMKGFDVLLAAVPEVLRHHTAEFAIVGEGPERGSLEAAAAGLPVTLPGALLEPREVASFLRGLDLFVLPSRSEGLPNVVLEAQSCGVQVVTTSAPGMAEAVPGGAMVPPDDPAALAAAIVAALGEPVAPTPPAINTFDAVAAQHLDVFTRAVAAHRG